MVEVNALQSHVAWCSRQDFARDFTTVFLSKLAFFISCFILVEQPCTHIVYLVCTFIQCFFNSFRILPLTSRTVHRQTTRRESPINWSEKRVSQESPPSHTTQSVRYSKNTWSWNSWTCSNTWRTTWRAALEFMERTRTSFYFTTRLLDGRPEPGLESVTQTRYDFHTLCSFLTVSSSFVQFRLVVRARLTREIT